MFKTLVAASLVLSLYAYCETEPPFVLEQLTLPGWSTDETAALSTAQMARKPLVIAFLGDGWCPWSEKIATEILAKREFIDEVASDVVLLHLCMTQAQTEKAAAIREKYQVYHCPQVIAYAEDGEEIGRIEYAPLHAKEYARNILSLISKFHEIRSTIDHPQIIETQEQLVSLYESAKGLSAPFYKEKLLEIGLAKDKGAFFILEKYAALLQKYKLRNPLVQQIRKKVLEKDPKNHQGTHLHLAILEFQKLAHTLRSRESPDKAVAPLIEYLRTHANDRENSWKVELMMAQFYFSKNCFPSALRHARASLSAAPEQVKEEIEGLIECFTHPASPQK